MGLLDVGNALHADEEGVFLVVAQNGLDLEFKFQLVVAPNAVLLVELQRTALDAVLFNLFEQKAAFGAEFGVVRSTLELLGVVEDVLLLEIDLTQVTELLVRLKQLDVLLGEAVEALDQFVVLGLAIFIGDFIEVLADDSRVAEVAEERGTLGAFLLIALLWETVAANFVLVRAGVAEFEERTFVQGANLTQLLFNHNKNCCFPRASAVAGINKFVTTSLLLFPLEQL